MNKLYGDVIAVVLIVMIVAGCLLYAGFHGQELRDQQEINNLRATLTQCQDTVADLSARHLGH